jgi:hypothetical protein
MRTGGFFDWANVDLVEASASHAGIAMSKVRRLLIDTEYPITNTLCEIQDHPAFGLLHWEHIHSLREWT